MPTRSVDLLVVGSGPTGAAAARRAAEEFGWKVLVVDRRPQVGGNCFDEYHESGVLIHRYGPHLFRTESDALLSWLSRFTEWVPGQYYVKSWTGGRYYTLPISLVTLEEFYGREITPESAEALFRKMAIPCEQPANSEEFILSRVGRDLYEAFYVGYTLKQWGKHPRELGPEVCGRVPIRLNRDTRYVGHKHQVMPRHGYASMFTAMLDNENIEVVLGTDYREVRDKIRPRRGVVYTGGLDEYFDNRLGPLPWRSLRFEYDVYEEEFHQPCQAVNYPNDYEYTRTGEIKHTTGQKHSRTVVAREYPTDVGEPYYPMPTPEAKALAERYRELARQEFAERGVLFAGRLAEYRYLDIDHALERGLAAAGRVNGQ